jgi:chromosomal replication initiation ATPase DnaA
MSKVQQLRLMLRRPSSYRLQDFIVSPTNLEAMQAIATWPDWHGGCLALVGPEGVGKTHLAMAWAGRVGAAILDRETPDLTPAAARPALIEDVDRGVPGEALFHLINMAGAAGAGLLLTARTPPSAWPSPLPDLRSRLNAMPVVVLGEPDDVVLEGILRKLFRERNIRPTEDVFPYLLRRMERSATQAREIVRRLDEAADAEQRAISRALARQVLESDKANLDLFE